MDIFRVVGWLVPSACIAGAGLIIHGRLQALNVAVAADSEAKKQLSAAILEKAQVDIQTVPKRFAAAKQNDLEETLFLSELKARTSEAGIVLTRWTSKATAYDSATRTIDPEVAALLKSITKIECDLTVTGSYPGIRQFLKGLESDDRLFTVSNVFWARGDNGTELSLSLDRYVGPNGPTASPYSPEPSTQPTVTITQSGHYDRAAKPLPTSQAQKASQNPAKAVSATH